MHKHVWYLSCVQRELRKIVISLDTAYFQISSCIFIVRFIVPLSEEIKPLAWHFVTPSNISSVFDGYRNAWICLMSDLWPEKACKNTCLNGPRHISGYHSAFLQWDLVDVSNGGSKKTHARPLSQDAIKRYHKLWKCIIVSWNRSRSTEAHWGARISVGRADFSKIMLHSYS